MRDREGLLRAIKDEKINVTNEIGEVSSVSLFDYIVYVHSKIGYRNTNDAILLLDYFNEDWYSTKELFFYFLEEMEFLTTEGFDSEDKKEIIESIELALEKIKNAR